MKFDKNLYEAQLAAKEREEKRKVIEQDIRFSESKVQKAQEELEIKKKELEYFDLFSDTETLSVEVDDGIFTFTVNKECRKILKINVVANKSRDFEGEFFPITEGEENMWAVIANRFFRFIGKMDEVIDFVSKEDGLRLVATMAKKYMKKWEEVRSIKSETNKEQGAQDIVLSDSEHFNKLIFHTDENNRVAVVEAISSDGRSGGSESVSIIQGQRAMWDFVEQYIFKYIPELMEALPRFSEEDQRKINELFTAMFLVSHTVATSGKQAQAKRQILHP